MNGGHLGDSLSALLDGELAEQETSAARSHLEGCASCRVELAAVGHARDRLRAAPPVEPPGGFERRLRPRRRRGWVVGAAGAVAASSVALVGLTAPHEAPVSPPVGRLVQAHAASASVDAEPVSQLVPAAVPMTRKR